MGGCCGLTGSLYDGEVSPGTFRISCDWRAGGHSGGQAATSHATGERAFESLGGGQARPTLLSLLLKCHAYVFHFGSNFVKRFEAHTTKNRFKGFHTSYVAHQGRARGGASSLSEKSSLVVAFRLLFKHTFYGTRHPKTVQRTPSLSPLTQPTLAPPLSCLGVLFPFSFLKKVPTP